MATQDQNTGIFRKAIVRAIVFFDLLEYPLTLQEIWKNLFFMENIGRPVTEINEILNIIEADLLDKIIEQKNGFYFLSGRSALVDARMKSQVLSAEKYKIALGAARYMKYIPGIKMAAVCNSLAMGNAKEKSDIDFFIVSEKGRVWTVRLFANLISMIRAMRPQKNDKNNKICLSFFVSEEYLDLEKIALESDPYFYFWLASLDPIYDSGIFGNLISKNVWLKKYLPNYSPRMPHPGRSIKKVIFNPLYYFACNGLEKFARFVQMKKMSQNKLDLARTGDSRVIISDAMLKFHETDRREEFFNAWKNKLNEISE